MQRCFTIIQLLKLIIKNGISDYIEVRAFTLENVDKVLMKNDDSVSQYLKWKSNFQELILEYFEHIKNDELRIIKQLYTIHIIYKNTLSKKMKVQQVDEFILNYLDIPATEMKKHDRDGIQALFI
jgi:hypothetical protein